jgi:hypothetical protein
VINHKWRLGGEKTNRAIFRSPAVLERALVRDAEGFAEPRRDA